MGDPQSLPQQQRLDHPDSEIDPKWEPLLRAAKEELYPATNQRNGCKNELIVCVDLLSNGFDVFKNLSGTGCDLAAWKYGKFFGIEVKSGHHRVGKQYRNKGEPVLPRIEPHQLDRCDVVAVVNPEGFIQYHAKPKLDFACIYGYGGPYNRAFDVKEKIKLLWIKPRK